ncbi:MAG: hypothetical protein HQL90_14585 [Magnetococcales bacterium]|nr:hypothetical protein [Magnetococcales bacterium]
MNTTGKGCWWFFWLMTVGAVVPIGPIQAATGSESPACPAAETPVNVEVRFDSANPFIDDSRSRAWIQNKARQLHHPVGLTESRLAHTLTAHFEIRSTGKTQTRCIYLKSISLILGYPSIKIYIANAYQAGSCEYQAIHRHEVEHVRIINGHQERSLPQWQSQLQALARTIRPLPSNNPQQAQQGILQKLDQAVRKEIQRSEKILKAQQAAIDTTQSYAKVQASCRQW